MTAEPPAFPGWNWEDPDGLAGRFDGLNGQLRGVR
jgi:hypothetical protein